MNAAKWSRVNQIFAAALELSSEERSLFLGRECATDWEARREVERLLAEHERTSGVLDRPLFAAAPHIEEEFATGHVLASRYRIERFIACDGQRLSGARSTGGGPTGNRQVPARMGAAVRLVEE
jgi:hypothetical protein